MKECNGHNNILTLSCAQVHGVLVMPDALLLDMALQTAAALKDDSNARPLLLTHLCLESTQQLGFAADAVVSCEGSLRDGYLRVTVSDATLCTCTAAQVCADATLPSSFFLQVCRHMPAFCRATKAESLLRAGHSSISEPLCSILVYWYWVGSVPATLSLRGRYIRQQPACSRA